MTIKHKSNTRFRKTACGLYYDELMRNSELSILSRLKGHWRLVTCKNCLKVKDNINEAFEDVTNPSKKK